MSIINKIVSGSKSLNCSFKKDSRATFTPGTCIAVVITDDKSKFFYDNYKSVVVLANPNTVLNARYAKKEIKNQVIRADRLTEYIKSVNGSDILINEDAMERYANFFLSLHKENETDYTARYADMIKNTEPAQETWPADTDSVPLCPKCGAVMVKRKAAKGAFAGNEFWGCSNYPRCRYIINISSGNKP